MWTHVWHTLDYSRRRARLYAIATDRPRAPAIGVGIFGGDARRLSLRSCFPALAGYEEAEGSLLLGAIRSDVNSTPLPPPDPGTDALLARVAGARVWTLQSGLSTLSDRLVEWLRGTGAVRIESGARCEGLYMSREKPFDSTNATKAELAQPVRIATASDVASAGSGGVTVRLSDGRVLEADHVVSTLSARELGAVLREADPITSGHLEKFPLQSIVIVNLVFRGDLLSAQGFGYLVPTIEPDNDVLGVVFDSAAFPEQDDPYVLGSDIGTTTKLTVMSGGYKHHELYGDGPVDESVAIELSLKAVRRQLGITVVRKFKFKSTCEAVAICFLF